MPGDCRKVGIMMYQCDIVSDGDRGNQTVHDRPWSLTIAATLPEKGGGELVVPRCRAQGDAAGEEAAKGCEMHLITGSGENFHCDRFAHVRFLIKERINSLTHRTTRITQELNPRRGVDEMH